MSEFYTNNFRPIDDISAVEWARYEQARRIHDTKKLWTLMPKWIKAHMATVAPPKPFRFVPGQPPVLPNLFTRLQPGPPPIPRGQFDSTIEYVKTYDQARSFKNAYDLVTRP